MGTVNQIILISSLIKHDQALECDTTFHDSLPRRQHQLYGQAESFDVQPNQSSQLRRAQIPDQCGREAGHSWELAPSVHLATLQDFQPVKEKGGGKISCDQEHHISQYDHVQSNKVYLT